jgi:hypothetical protein
MPRRGRWELLARSDQEAGSILLEVRLYIPGASRHHLQLYTIIARLIGHTSRLKKDTLLAIVHGV